MADNLAEHRCAIGEGAIERQFGYPHSPRILAVFEDDKALELTLEHISRRKDFEKKYCQFSFLKALASIARGFWYEWHKIRGKTAFVFCWCLNITKIYISSVYFSPFFIFWSN